MKQVNTTKEFMEYKKKIPWKVLEGYPIYIDDDYINDLAATGMTLPNIPMACADVKDGIIIMNSLLADRDHEFAMGVIYHELGHLAHPEHGDLAKEMQENPEDKSLWDKLVIQEMEADQYAVDHGYREPLLRLLSELGIETLMAGSMESWEMVQERVDLLRKEK